MKSQKEKIRIAKPFILMCIICLLLIFAIGILFKDTGALVVGGLLSAICILVYGFALWGVGK